MSSRPSPFRSPRPISPPPYGSGEPSAGRKPPRPSPSRTAVWFLAQGTTRSSLPSPLTSPTATFCGPPATAIGEPGAGANGGEGEPASAGGTGATARRATGSRRHMENSSARAGCLPTELQRRREPVRAVKLRTDRFGRLEFVSDPPAQISLDSGRAVVVAV